MAVCAFWMKTVTFWMKSKNQFIWICTITALHMALITPISTTTIYGSTTGSQVFICILSNVILATISQGIYYYLHAVDEETVPSMAGQLQIQYLKQCLPVSKSCASYLTPCCRLRKYTSLLTAFDW